MQCLLFKLDYFIESPAVHLDCVEMIFVISVWTGSLIANCDVLKDEPLFALHTWSNDWMIFIHCAYISVILQKRQPVLRIFSAGDSALTRKAMFQRELWMISCQRDVQRGWFGV